MLRFTSALIRRVHPLVTINRLAQAKKMTRRVLNVHKKWFCKGWFCVFLRSISYFFVLHLALAIRHVSFVDCPGHDILMATMLNGAAVMDAALLLIAGFDHFLIFMRKLPLTHSLHLPFSLFRKWDMPATTNLGTFGGRRNHETETYHHPPKQNRPCQEGASCWTTQANPQIRQRHNRRRLPDHPNFSSTEVQHWCCLRIHMPLYPNSRAWLHVEPAFDRHPFLWRQSTWCRYWWLARRRSWWFDC